MTDTTTATEPKKVSDLTFREAMAELDAMSPRLRATLSNSRRA